MCLPPSLSATPNPSLPPCYYGIPLKRLPDAVGKTDPTVLLGSALSLGMAFGNSIPLPGTHSLGWLCKYDGSRQVPCPLPQLNTKLPITGGKQGRGGEPSLPPCLAVKASSELMCLATDMHGHALKFHFLLTKLSQKRRKSILFPPSIPLSLWIPF